MSILQPTRIVSIISFLLFVSSNIFAQNLFELNIADNKPKDWSTSKMTSDLEQLYNTTVKNTNRYGIDAKSASNNPILSIEETYISVELIATKAPKSILNQLNSFDFELSGVFKNIISGRLPIEDLESLTKIDGIKYIRPSYLPINHAGSVDSQGDTSMHAQAVRSEYNLDGSGFKIGLLSDSYNTLSGAATAVSTGDLPGTSNPDGYTTPVTVTKEYFTSGADEARGMAEIIHDVAPGAQIYARTAFEGIADFAQGIVELADSGCHVIVDDVSYFSEPFFQDGHIAQAIDSVVNNGVVYFTSAGNMGRKSYEANGITDSGSDFFGGDMHDFDPSSGVDFTQQITIPAGVTLTITLQWDDPFGSLPGAVAQADTDLNLFLINSAFTTFLATSTTNNLTTGDPYEVISYQNTTGSDLTTNLVITHNSGPNPGFLKYVCWTNDVTIDEYDTASGTIVGHANSEGAITCGAAAFYNTLAYGATKNELNNFSSAGGTPILFDKVGNPISTLYRNKPDLIGPDGSNTTFFGVDITNDNDSYPNFFGTSAAAPHLAAGTLLLKEMGATDRTQIMNAYTSTSEDMDDPATVGEDVGFDYGTGYGMAQVDEAITYFASLPVDLIDFSVISTGANAGRLHWSTASEQNNKSFIIEHQFGDRSYRTIATLDGKGDSQVVNYYHQDVKNLAPGTHYFRLKQQDLDGRITDHGIVSLEVKVTTQKMWTYQDGSVQTLVLEATQQQNLTITVFDNTGKLMKEIKVNTSGGERLKVALSESHWVSGTYYFQINSSWGNDLPKGEKFIHRNML